MGLDRESLFFSDLDKPEIFLEDVVNFLKSKDIYPSGVGCFDCESLANASKLAAKLELPFPNVEAISKARNKFESKRIWTEKGIRCPIVSVAGDMKETLAFFNKVRKSVVIKPVSASGSELTFFCKNEKEISETVNIVTEQLLMRKSSPFFRKLPEVKGTRSVDPSAQWIVEEYISGTEFSCDFVLSENRVDIIRLTEKVKDDEQTFGSILAYCIPADLPEGFSLDEFASILNRAALSLGFNHGWFMVDFIICDNAPYLIEVTPRPGGDSIPDLYQTATGEDILGTYLDYISGRIEVIKPIEYRSKSLASINIYANDEGVITELDCSVIKDLPWVRKTFISKSINDIIILPPSDYDSRKIGHCIVHSKGFKDLKEKQQILLEMIGLSIKPHAGGFPERIKEGIF